MEGKNGAKSIGSMKLMFAEAWVWGLTIIC